MRFVGKVVLITGAARGIGLAAAIEFAAEGACVIATDRDAAALAEAHREIGRHGDVHAYPQNVTDEAAWAAIMARVIADHGKLDVLVNNAGIVTLANIEDTTFDAWRRVISVNLDGVFLGTRAAIGAMKTAGGVIINLASVESLVGDALLPAYDASKGGVYQLTKSASLHCANAGYPIRVVSMHPGFADTPMAASGLADLTAEQAEAEATKLLAKIPFGRLATAREIARPILFLASDDASYMTGSGLVVDGGYTAA